MEKIQLTDESRYPDEQALQEVLGNAYEAYPALLELFQERGLVLEWRYYNDGKAWLCKVQRKSKTIVWISAWEGYLKAGIYIPERLMEGVYALPIDEDRKKQFRESRNVGRSKECIFELRSRDVLPELDLVMQYKATAK